ncbi:MAG: DUF4112 domain-containing protein [Planctomycetes bacterium]|nr:DUF4112 domain-containing protein [Planctomycetota bacterium]
MSPAPTPVNDLARIDDHARWLDAAFQIPGTRFRVGWDAILGLIPGLGDSVGLLLSGSLLWRARRLGLHRRAWIKMAINLALDATLGAIPILGDLFDAWFRSNLRNAKIIRREIERRPDDPPGRIA